MKQIYHYFILLLCLLSAACDNDDNSPVKAYIIKSDTTFEAKGGNGTIEVSTGNLICQFRQRLVQSRGRREYHPYHCPTKY